MWHVNLWGQFCVLGYQLALDKLYINYTCITILWDRAFNYLQPVTTDIDLFLFALHLDAYTRSVAWWGERWYQCGDDVTCGGGLGGWFRGPPRTYVVAADYLLACACSGYLLLLHLSLRGHGVIYLRWNGIGIDPAHLLRELLGECVKSKGRTSKLYLTDRSTSSSEITYRDFSSESANPI
jgi:hypothetical protein